jgi:hypothetical protein
VVHQVLDLGLKGVVLDLGVLGAEDAPAARPVARVPDLGDPALGEYVVGKL